MTAQITLHKEYPNRQINIPFEEGDISLLKLRVRDNADNAAIFNDAVDIYITHYFPEFYRNMEDSAFVGDNTNYDELRALLTSALSFENPGFDTRPPSAYKIVITRIDVGRSLYQVRNQWIRQRKLPDFQDNLEFFNQQQNIGSEVLSYTQMPLDDALSPISTFTELMTSFGSQKNNYNGAVPVGGLNFPGLAKSVNGIWENIFEGTGNDIRARIEGIYQPAQGDMVTIYFGNRTGPPPGSLSGQGNDPLNLLPDQIAINGIVFFAADALASDFFKVGYFTMIKYRKIFNDQLTLSMLKNYENLISQANEYQTAGTTYPMFDFLSQLGPNVIDEVGSGDFFSFPTPNDRNLSGQSLLEKEAIRLGLIDVNDTDELQQGIKALTTEELLQLKNEVAKNPELYAAVYEEEKRKKLETGRDIAATIAQVLQSGPMGLLQENSQVDRILEQIGLKALAKEALICLTFGVNIELARIADIVGNTLEEELNERPSMDPEQFELFKIKGDIGKMVLEAILNGLKSALMTVIKTLAEQLREVCNLNNPRASDYGAVDIADLIQNNFLDPLAGQTPFGYGNDENNALGDLINMLGMTPEEILQYLRDISTILSSIDICVLLMDTQGASAELIDRVIDYNIQYPNSNISTKLAQPSPVVQFWTLLGNIVDVSDLCNEILTDISLLNQDNICLDLDALDDAEMQNIEDLLDIIENGFQQSPPVFNFDCPDAEHYINDPVISRLIPETLSTMVEVVELQFIYSTDSIKNVLLEPTLARADGRSGAGSGESAYDTAVTTMTESGRNPNDFPELPEPNTEALSAVADALNQLSEDPTGIYQALEDCIVDANILAPGITSAAEAIDIIIDILGNAEVQGALSNIQDKMAAVTDGGTGPAVNTYRFNQQFYNAFADYIDIAKSDYVSDLERGSRVTAVNDEISSVQTRLAAISPTATDGRRQGLERRLNLLQGELAQLTQAANRETFLIHDHFRRYVIDGTSESQIEFTFPRFNSPDKQFINLTYPSYGNTITPRPHPIFELSALFSSETEDLFRTEIEGPAGGVATPYSMDLFVNAARNAPGYDINTTTAQRKYFPFAYGVVVDQIFDYYTENGIFDAATLQSLNFFHDNANCAADDVADLLDVAGIFQQMQQE